MRSTSALDRDAAEPAHGLTTSSPLIRALNAQRGIVCFTGAGGKKSAMYRIAAEHEGRVALTSTVHMHPYTRRVTSRIVDCNWPDFREQLAASSRERVVAFVSPSAKPNRHGGLSGEQITAIHASSGVDVCLVKADGARSRWIKAPAPHEPVFPERFDTLVPVVSARAIGSCLGDKIAHRPERIASVTGATEGGVITPEHLARLLAAPEGALKGSDRADAVIPLINMVDTTALHELARDCALQVFTLTSRIDRIVLCSLSTRGVIEIVERDRTRPPS